MYIHIYLYTNIHIYVYFILCPRGLLKSLAPMSRNVLIWLVNVELTYQHRHIENRLRSTSMFVSSIRRMYVWSL